LSVFPRVISVPCDLLDFKSAAELQMMQQMMQQQQGGQGAPGAPTGEGQPQAVPAPTAE
jgi:hypothetical protein